MHQPQGRHRCTYEQLGSHVGIRTVKCTSTGKSKLTAAPNDQIGALEFLFFTNFFLEYICFPMICGISKALIFLFGKKVSFFPWCQASRDKVSSLHPVVIENQVGTKSLENNRGKRCWRESYHIFLLPES